MEQHIGVDLVEIGRIQKAVDRWGDAFLNRIYTETEITRYRCKPASLAARFACKEAVMKLLGTGKKGTGWKDIETISGPGGKPVVNLYGRAKSHAARLGFSRVSVSISHSREYAIASVIATSPERT